MNISKKIPTLPQHAPLKWVGPDYGAKNQWTSNESGKHILLPEDRKYIQVVGNFIYYARSVEPTTSVDFAT